MRHLTISSICASLPVLFAAVSALAAERFALVGTYQSYGDVLGIVTSNNPQTKIALFAVDATRLNKPTARIAVGFLDGPDWRRFEQLWLKGRRTAPPPAGAKDTEIGDYFDGAGNAMTVYVVADGSVEFALASKFEGEAVIKLFRIAPKDLERFDGDVKKVTDYFTH